MYVDYYTYFTAMSMQAATLLNVAMFDAAAIPNISGSANNIYNNQVDTVASAQFDDLFAPMLFGDTTQPVAPVVPALLSDLTADNKILPETGNNLPFGLVNKLPLDRVQADPALLQLTADGEPLDSVLPDSAEYNDFAFTLALSPQEQRAVATKSIDDNNLVKGMGYNQYETMSRIQPQLNTEKNPLNGSFDENSAYEEMPEWLSKQQGVPEPKSQLLSPAVDIEKFAVQYHQSKLIKAGQKADSLRALTEVTSKTSDSQVISLSGLSSAIHDTKPVSQLILPQPVTSPQWANDFSDRIRWLLNNNLQKAELSLNPKNLGSIDVTITVTNDQTSIHIAAQNSVARDTVENSLGRLRDILESSGVNLGDVDVSQHSRDDDRSSQHEETAHYDTSCDDDTSVMTTANLEVPGITHRLIDYYA